MSTPEFLNVDEIASPVSKSIKLNGKTHTMLAPTVLDFVNETKTLRKRREDLAAAQKMGVPEEELTVMFFKGMVEDVKKSFPTIGDDADNMTLQQLFAVSEFISGVINKESAEASGNA